MSISAQQLVNADIPSARRGYDRTVVDRLLDQAADELDRVTAERDAALAATIPAAPAVDADAEIRGVIALAARAAEAATREAEADAAEVVAAARDRAADLLEAANAHVADLVAAEHHEVAAATEQAHTDLATVHRELDAARAELAAAHEQLAQVQAVEARSRENLRKAFQDGIDALARSPQVVAETASVMLSAGGGKHEDA